MEYTITYGDSLVVIITRVNELIKKGWKPQGGICQIMGNFYQAMIKE